MSTPSLRIVVIGGVACGPKAAARARRCDPHADIVLIERGELISYAGCGLPYYVGGSVESIDNLRTTTFGLLRDETYFSDVKNIDVRIRTEVRKIDRHAKTVEAHRLDTGEAYSLPYDRLVLATGATPATPPIEGLDLGGVHTLHTPHDARQIRAAIDSGDVDRAVIIGAGLIGLEAIESFFNQAVDVTVVEMAGTILPSVLDSDMACLLARDLAREGVEILSSQTVLRLEGDGRVTKVVTQDREIETDLVIVAAGVHANVELARDAGLDIGETGAIAVNEFMQTSDEDIYAGGDCVECLDLVSGAKVFAPLGSTANRHGRVIGGNITGGREVFPGIVGTVILKSMNLNVAKSGLTEARATALGYDTVTSKTPCLDRVHFYPGNKSFLIKFVAGRPDGRLLGAQLIGAGEVAKRVDVLATALRYKATLADVANLDLAYSPPFAHALDGVIHAANTTRNRISGQARAVSAAEVQDRLAQGSEFTLLDVREPAEVEKTPLSAERVIHIPLSQLRRRLDELPKDGEILCLCQQGTRGYEAVTILAGSGFTRVAFYDGGLRAWSCVEAPVNDTANADLP